MPGTAPHPAGFGCVSFFVSVFRYRTFFQAHHPGEVFSSRTIVSRQVSAICCNGHESSRMKRWVTVLRQQGQRPSVESTGGGNRASPLNTVSGCGSGKSHRSRTGAMSGGVFFIRFSLCIQGDGSQNQCCYSGGVTLCKHKLLIIPVVAGNHVAVLCSEQGERGSSQDMVWSSSLCEDGTGFPVPLRIN